MRALTAAFLIALAALLFGSARAFVLFAPALLMAIILGEQSLKPWWIQSAREGVLTHLYFSLSAREIADCLATAGFLAWLHQTLVGLALLALTTALGVIATILFSSGSDEYGISLAYLAGFAPCVIASLAYEKGILLYEAINASARSTALARSTGPLWRILLPFKDASTGVAVRAFPTLFATVAGGGLTALVVSRTASPIAWTAAGALTGALTAFVHAVLSIGEWDLARARAIACVRTRLNDILTNNPPNADT